MLLECGPPSTGTRVAGGGILTLSHCRHLCERERPAVVVKAVVTLSVLHFFFITANVSWDIFSGVLAEVR